MLQQLQRDGNLLDLMKQVSIFMNGLKGVADTSGEMGINDSAGEEDYEFGIRYHRQSNHVTPPTPLFIFSLFSNDVYPPLTYKPTDQPLLCRDLNSDEQTRSEVSPLQRAFYEQMLAMGQMTHPIKGLLNKLSP